jgi:hypothetical protein
VVRVLGAALTHHTIAVGILFGADLFGVPFAGEATLTAAFVVVEDSVLVHWVTSLVVLC